MISSVGKDLFCWCLWLWMWLKRLSALCHSQEKPSRDRWGHRWRASPIYTAPDTCISCTTSYVIPIGHYNHTAAKWSQVETKAVISQHNSCCGHMNSQLIHITICVAFSATSTTINQVDSVHVYNTDNHNSSCTLYCIHSFAERSFSHAGPTVWKWNSFWACFKDSKSNILILALLPRPLYVVLYL